VRIKTVPDDFHVEEQIEPPLDPDGPYTLYRVEKRSLTTPQVEQLMARALHRRPSTIHFPGLKDKRAVAVQYVTVRGKGPQQLKGPGFRAQRVGRTAAPLRPSHLVGNRFTIVVRDLAREQAEGLRVGLESLTSQGLPNYFDRQRFGSQIRASGELPGRRIFLRDAEGALHAHLAEPMVGDPRQVRAFKRAAAAQWEAWDAVFDAAPRPSNFRSVLTYLRDHPTAGSPHRERTFRRALNLVTPRILRIYIDAYQSFLWNRIVAHYLTRQLGQPRATIRIARQPLPLFPDLANRLALPAIPLPYHRASYRRPELAQVVDAVLEEEGLALGDLKPRILQRAYLPRGSRPILLCPQAISVSHPVADDRFPDRYQVTLAFTLPPGAYATLVLRALT
jgi:tRNA pseudouridine13 synthase